MRRAHSLSGDIFFSPSEVPSFFSSETRAPRLPTSILFACTFNSVRSPLAEALGRRLFPSQIHFASVGVRAGPLDPFMVKVLEEIGIDLSSFKPRSFEDLEDTNFDLIVTLSPEAHHKALEFVRYMATDVAYWPTLDPTAVEGTRETVLQAYRALREDLHTRIKQKLNWFSPASL